VWLAAVLSGALLLPLFLPAVAGADVAEVRSLVQDVQNDMIVAAQQVGDGDLAGALATIDGAAATLAAVNVGLTDPAVQAELGRTLRRVEKAVGATVKKVAKARSTVEDGRKKLRTKLSKLRVAAKSAMKTVQKLGTSMLAEITDETAGFHTPGEQAQFQITLPCAETPTVTIENLTPSQAIDPVSVVVDAVTGVITFVMGNEEGAAHVTVTACGASVTVLVYNYGPEPPPGFPRDFPLNLPPGMYLVTVSASGIVVIPETPIGTLQLDDVMAFYAQLEAALTGAFEQMSGLSGLPCSASTRFSPWDGDSFAANISLRCSVAGQSFGITARVRVEQI
jgi:hypothetical protein